ncbi:MULTISPECIES: thiamine phosphate synthase [unclassified Thioalkalivibrio]|uniref:thiamine phosphate synthase n=1 Tax=unclassified Thioalkalivibrio TaxID=2621013 RepID=UPI0003669728|nr:MULTISPECIES: thiamine phosphate synthase [unclassified Thioalkalivibrio]
MTPERDPRLRGLYFITPPVPEGADPRATHLENSRAALRGGARLIQFRDKVLTGEARAAIARELVALAHAHGALCIINDDTELAARVEADGVHLGRDDPDPAAARMRLGPGAMVGVSCYNELERARAALADGASYAAFGSVFPSPTKPDAVRAELDLFREARAKLELPICAIGGITPENASDVVAAGADMVAVIQGVSAAPDPEAAAHRIAGLFNPGETD